MNRKAMIVLWAPILGSVSQMALAQGLNETDAGSPSESEIPEIVVTAERTTSTAQKTPLAITVLSGDELTRQGIKDAGDLNGKIPNINVANNNGTMTVNVRGVGTSYDNQSAEPAVNINIDGVYLSRATGAVGAFYDIERVEALRGPQGTLYGRNSTGGSINIITRKPVDELQGQAELEVGNYDHIRTFGMLNVPVISGTLAVRAAFQTERHDGYTDNAPATDYNDADSVSARFHALFTPTSDISLLLSADYSHFGGVGPNHVLAPIAFDTYEVPFDTDGRRDTPLYGYSAQLDWRLSDLTLSYIGAYRYFHRDQVLDSDSTFTASPDRDSLQIWDWKNETWSHELRLASSPLARLKWLIGTFYYIEHNDYKFTSKFFSPTTDSTFYNNPIAGGKSYAVFGQSSYKLTDQLSMTAGIRYTRDEKYEDGTTTISLANGTQRVVINQADLSWNNVSGRFGIDWAPTSKVLVYASISNGYKAGGYYDGLNNRYAPEKLIAYEGGVKSRMLDNRLQLNLAGFYYDYRDYQAVYVDIVQGSPVPATANAKKARTFGGELEGILLIGEGGTLNVSGSYLNARFNDFILPGATPQNYSGFSMPRSPRWSVDAGYSHRWSLDNGAAIVGDIKTHYQTGTWLMFQHSPNSYQDSYTRTNLSLTYEAPEKQWNISAFVRNIEGDPIASNAVAGPRGSILVDLLAPRTYGIRFGARF